MYDLKFKKQIGITSKETLSGGRMGSTPSSITSGRTHNWTSPMAAPEASAHTLEAEMRNFCVG